MRCLTGTRFTMNAEVLRWEGIDEGNEDDTGQGSFETYQDPITGEILNRWTSIDTTGTPVPEGDPDTFTINCLARGIVDGGIRVAGTTERFGDSYENIDYVKLWTPANVFLSKRDRITNIRERRGGRVIWVDEERVNVSRPTIFNVNGVTPLFDAFNKHVENFVLLERVDSYA